MRQSLGRRSIAGALVLGVVALVGGGVAYATIPGADGTIDGCYNTRSGTLRLVDTEAGGTCTAAERPISWQQAATMRCPEGTILTTGVCLETTPRAPDIHPDAVDDCADEGRRLPSPGELMTAALLPEIDLGGGEWTDDVADINRVDDETGREFGDFSIFSISERGNGVTQAFDDQAYRCVAGAVIG